MFSVGHPYDEIIKHLRKEKASDWLAGIENEGSRFNNGKNFACRRDLENSKTGETKTLFYIVFIDSFRFSDYEICKLAHEVLHICQFMMKDFLDPDREFESVAYTHTYIMQKCLKTMRSAHEQVNKKKKR